MNEEFGAVIPAYNETGHIGGVVRGIAHYLPISNILVIDDGSVDGTPDEAREAGAEVISNPVNLGKGSTLLKGFAIMGKRSGIDAVFTIDADGQHSPAEIPRFIDEYKEKGADIVIGSRMADTTGMPAIRKLTNGLTSWMISRRAGVKIEDSQSGYRLVRLSTMNALDLKTRNFDLESEMLIKAGRSGANILSVSISTIYGSEKSKINPIRDTLRFLRLVLRSYFW